jgi:hypothetical protein
MNKICYTRKDLFKTPCPCGEEPKVYCKWTPIILVGSIACAECKNHLKTTHTEKEDYVICEGVQSHDQRLLAEEYLRWEK